MFKQIARGCGMVLLGVLILAGGGWWYYRANDGLHRRGHRSPMDRQATTLYAALQAGDTRAIDQLLTQEPKLAYVRFGSDGTVLHVAARYNHPDVIRLLLQWGADVTDSSGRLGATPLHWAAWWGSTEAAAELIKSGAPLDAPASLGTPLRWAVRSAELHRNPRADYQALVRLLLDSGADVNGGDGRGWPPSLEENTAPIAVLLRGRGARLTTPETASTIDSPALARAPRR